MSALGIQASGKAPHSLRSRLIVTLLLCALIPLALVGVVSYLTIKEITTKKIETGLFNSLKLTSYSLQNTLNNMDYASLQLTNEGSVGEKLLNYLSTDNLYEQLQLRQDIQNNLNLVNFTNPNLGVMLYYFSDEKQVKFQNLAVVPDFQVDKLPQLAKSKGVVYYGPHRTLYRYGGNKVFSMVRPVMIPGDNEARVYVYIETNLQLFEQILNKQQYGMNATTILVNDEGNVVYSDSAAVYKPGMHLAIPSSSAAFKRIERKDYLFGQRNEQGWSLLVMINKKDYKHEFNTWLLNYVLVVSLGLAISLLLASVLWRIVYLPLKRVGNDIERMADGNANAPISYTHVIEFDILMRKSHQMRSRIQDLIAEVEQRERTKRRLEVEKLLYQINPHFIHNTLNTIQWIAKANGQTEIDRLISVFTRILYYNLGKKGEIVTLKEEIEALRDYVALQRIRYDYEFEVLAEVDAKLMEVPIPRFILQPIVENAIYHGLDDENGKVVVRIARQGERRMIVEVSDNGEGMSAEEISKLMTEDKNPLGGAGLGIGLDYVKRVLTANYGDDFPLSIASMKGQGTTVKLTIPLVLPEAAGRGGKMVAGGENIVGDNEGSLR